MKTLNRYNNVNNRQTREINKLSEGKTPTWSQSTIK